jgi:sulfopyruvate decarboxylase TPP-binding subunit
MSGKRVIVLMQNVGFLNSIGCFATLCVNYRTPFLIVVSHRGNIHDKNAYDILKYKYFELIVKNIGVFTIYLSANINVDNIVKNLFDRAMLAQEPSLLVLDRPINNDES